MYCYCIGTAAPWWLASATATFVIVGRWFWPVPVPGDPEPNIQIVNDNVVMTLIVITIAIASCLKYCTVTGPVTGNRYDRCWGRARALY